MKKIVLALLLMSTMLTACSFVPRKSKAATAEKYAKKYINEQVCLVDKKGDSQKDSYQMRTVYHLKDDRNIEFNVRVDDEFVSFVDAVIPNLYTNKLIYTTDYRSKVMNYYADDIDEILSGLKLKKDYTRDIKSAYLRVCVSEEESLENIAEAIMKIDNLLNYNYKLSSEAMWERIKWDACWDAGMDGTINIEMPNPDGTNKRLIFEVFEFSDGNEHILTYEKVLRTLKADMMQRQSDENILLVYLNDTLFYGIDTLYSAETKDDIAEYDGKMEYYNQMVPQKNGYGNIGSDIPYKFGTDGEVYVYMPDGCRQLHEMK